MAKATVDKTEGAGEPDKRDAKRCLMITPIDAVDSDVRRATDGLYDEVIVPVCEELGYEADVSHRMNEPGSIMDQVVGRLIDDDLVIANLTLSNPNVMYELAIRHAAKKPVICLLHEGSTLPFDLLIERVIRYRNDMKGVGVLRKDLAETIRTVEAAGGVVDNPVVRGAKRFKLTREDVSQTEFQALMKRLDSIEARIAPGSLPNEAARKILANYREIVLHIEGGPGAIGEFVKLVESHSSVMAVHRISERMKRISHSETSPALEVEARAVVSRSTSPRALETFLFSAAQEAGVTLGID